MSAAIIEFFWDPASPYTYLAATQIEALAARHGATVVWRPFVLGKVFEATGNRAPATVAAKAKHLFQDVQRWATLYGVPFRFPTIFPINGIAAMRAACAADDAGHGGAFAQAIMKAYWADGADIAKPEAIAAVASAIGLDGEALIARTADAEIKDRLRANTEEAVKRGAFGAPTMFVDGQMFWGNDRLVLLENHLKARSA